MPQTTWIFSLDATLEAFQGFFQNFLGTVLQDCSFVFGQIFAKNFEHVLIVTDEYINVSVAKKVSFFGKSWTYFTTRSIFPVTILTQETQSLKSTTYRSLFLYKPGPMPSFFKHTLRSKIQKLNLFEGLRSSWGSQKHKRRNNHNSTIFEAKNKIRTNFV